KRTTSGAGYINLCHLNVLQIERLYMINKLISQPKKEYKHSYSELWRKYRNNILLKMEFTR
ncbi:hypothetical protein, partial [Xenorhabdus ehlersii]|uniref:hypothetical protein n=1 Tax=Xenorhabdus ehlersii TaxID=290111 RepID=UPI001B80800D